MTDEPRSNDFSAARLDALTDGIFAIAMTILVLNINAPDLPDGADTATVFRALGSLVPQVLSYVLSFYILAQMWINNNRLKNRFRGTALGHIWLTMTSLLLICLIPFSTSLVDNHNGNLAAELVFHVNLLLAGLAFYAQWLFAVKDRRLIHESISEEQIRRGSRARQLLPATAVAAILFSLLIDPDWSSIFYIALPILGPRLDKSP